MRRSPELRWLRLHFPRGLSVDRVQAFVRMLCSASAISTAAFEISARGGEIEFRIGASSLSALRQLLQAHLPSVTTEAISPPPVGHGAWMIEAKGTGLQMLTVTDPVATSTALLGALAVNASTEPHRYRLTLTRRLAPQAVRSREGLHSSTVGGQLIEAVAFGNTKRSTQAQRALLVKRSLPGRDVQVTIAAPESTARAIADAWSALQEPGLRFRLRRTSTWRSAKQLPLNTDEIASILGWPLGEHNYPGVDRSNARCLPFGGRPAAGRVLAASTHPGSPGPIGLKVGDALRHLHVAGPTGVGKSTLLLQLILQDIAANRSVVVVDPKGDLVDDILARIPAPQLEQVVVIDPSREDYLVGFNPLQSARPELAVDGLVQVFATQYRSSWGPRTQDILHSGLLTLALSPTPTITELPRLLVDSHWRQQLLSPINLNDHLQLFWQWYDNLSDAERANVIAPVLNKLRPLLLRTSLRHTLQQTDTAFDLRRVFTERKVLLVALRKGLVGPQASSLLAGLLLSDLWQQTLRRSEIPPERRHPTLVYLDEFQDYLALPTDLADALAQARGLGVALTLAHQALAQLDAPMKAAVAANAQNKLVFRLGADDAREFVKTTPDLVPEDFMALKNFEVYARLLQDGELLPFASGRTLPPPPVLHDHRRVAAFLAQRWGTPPKHPSSQAERPNFDPDDIGRKRGGS